MTVGALGAFGPPYLGIDQSAEQEDRQPVRDLVEQLMGKNLEHRFQFIQSRAAAVRDDEIA